MQNNQLQMLNLQHNLQWGNIMNWFFSYATIYIAKHITLPIKEFVYGKNMDASYMSANEIISSLDDFDDI
jgi:hypothetical protein